MKWYIAIPLVILLGVGFWELLGAYKVGFFTSFGAWMLAVWSGAFLRQWIG